MLVGMPIAAMLGVNQVQAPMIAPFDFTVFHRHNTNVAWPSHAFWIYSQTGVK